MSADPIILVGMQRSGTTWMGRLLSRRPEIAYWVEPRPVWSFGHWLRGDDRLVAADATPRIVRHIRGRFADYTRAHGKARFCEKTPSNCVRLPFVRAVFPEARILLILRDGRSIIRSTNQIRQSGADWKRIRDRLRESAPWDWPSYLDRLPDLVDKLRGRPARFWGVRPPGWRSWVAEDSAFVAMAKQWSTAIRLAATDGRAMPPDRFLEIRYETLTSNPRQTMQQVVDFLELPYAGSLIEEAVTHADPSRGEKWRSELEPRVLEEVRPHMEATMHWLGYQW